ncbi:MAG: type II secretion system protein [Cyanobacteria bacterium P01_H01_bin.15]
MLNFPFEKESVQRLEQDGFTLVELLVVILFATILGTLIAPSFVGLLNRIRLNEAASATYEVMRSAQIEAQRQKLDIQASFRQDPTDATKLQYAIHPVLKDVNGNRTGNGIPANPGWQQGGRAVIEDDNINGRCPTTFQKSSSSPICATPGPYYVTFNYFGEALNLGKITLSTGSTAVRRCVTVSTLIGTLNTGLNNECD